MVFGEIRLGHLGMGLLVTGYVVNAFAALAAPGRLFSARRAWLIVTLPLYWPLQSLAAARAVYGVLNAPHFWAKTPHGLTADDPRVGGTSYAE